MSSTRSSQSSGGKMFLLTPVSVFVALMVLIALCLGIGGSSTSSSAVTATGGDPTSYAKQLIPSDILALDQSSSVKQECPGLSWTVVAAIVHLESDDNRNPGTSPNGAMGASQFLPSTWDKQGSLVVQVGAFGKVPDGQGYGLDGDGDGFANISDPADSIPATARYLCSNGGGDTATLPQAIYAYNHVWWYVYGGTSDSGSPFQGVLPLASLLANTTSTTTPLIGGISSDPVQLASNLLVQWQNKNLTGQPWVYQDLVAAKQDQSITSAWTCGNTIKIDVRVMQDITVLLTRYKLDLNNIVTEHGCDDGFHPKGKAFDIEGATDLVTGLSTNFCSGPFQQGDNCNQNFDNQSLDRQVVEFLAQVITPDSGLGQSECNGRTGVAMPSGRYYFPDTCTHQHVQVQYSTS